MNITIINELTYKVRGAIFKVHSSLGPGLLESVYVAALIHELTLLDMFVQTQLGIPVNYNGVMPDLGFRMDILVENQIVIEVKSVEVLRDVHKKQLLTYLKLANKKLGIL